MRTFFRSLAIGGLLLGGRVQAQTQPGAPLTLPKPVVQALDKVQPAALKSHITYLADDKLRGRQPGTPGYQLAVDYVSAQLKQMGVQPAGDRPGSYTHRVRRRRSTLKPGATLTWLASTRATEPLVLGQDAVIYPNPEAADVSMTAPLTFAGFGISAPELGHDNYAGLERARVSRNQLVPAALMYSQ